MFYPSDTARPLASRFARLGAFALAGLFCVVLTACDQDKQTQSSDSSPALTTPAAATASPADSSPGSSAARDVVAPPAGARYTVFCTAISGPNHADEATRMRDEVIGVTHWKDWYVVHQEQESDLYYGYFRSVNDANDPAESRRASSALTAITALTNGMGDHPFTRAMIVPLDAPDPDAPPQWNLCNSDKFWSVEVASYTGSPDRKKFAVDAVRAARAMGIEAYYYHGVSASSVCIGAWPEDAIERQAQSSVSADPGNIEQSLIYVPGNVADRLPADIRDSQGRPIKVLTDKVVIRDPTMKQVLEQYPHFAVNGEESSKTVNGQPVFQPSVPVIIPHSAPSLLNQGVSKNIPPADSDTMSPAADPSAETPPVSPGGSPDPSQPANPQPADANDPGQLRSLDSGR
jgi:hypothetical protein